MAEKVICHEIRNDKKVFINIVKEALERVAEHEHITIRVSPSSLDALNDPECTIKQAVKNSSGICIKEDQTISSGGCIIETNLGNIDARLEEKLRVIEEAFTSELFKCG